MNRCWENRREISRIISVIDKTNLKANELLEVNIGPDELFNDGLAKNSVLDKEGNLVAKLTKRTWVLNETHTPHEEQHFIIEFFKSFALFFTGTPSAASLCDRVKDYKDHEDKGL